MIGRIKTVFLPERIGNYFLFSTHITAIEAQKDHLVITRLTASGSTLEVHSCFKKELPSAETHDQQIVLALTQIADQLSGSTLVFAFESSHLFFKRLRLPFTQHEKLKMVLRFEIQPLLPFASNDAAIDCIATSQSPDGTDLFVAAAQKTAIAQSVNLFAQAGLHLSVVAPDGICLYALFKAYYNSEQPQTIVLIDISQHDTRLLYTYDKQLLFIRTLPKGFVDIIKSTAKAHNANPQTIMDHLMRFGLERTSDYQIETELRSQFERYVRDLSFTLTSFTTQSTTHVPAINKILLSGEGALIKGIDTSMTHHLHIATERLKCHDLLMANNVTIQKSVTLDDSYAISLGAAILPFTQPEFNLAPEARAQEQATRTLTTLITSAVLSVCIMMTVIGSLYQQSRSFNAQAEETASELIEALTKISGVVESEEEAEATVDDRVQNLLSKANTRIKEREKLVNEFSNANKQSLLQYLYEFAQLDRNTLGLTIEELTISPERVLFKGNVKTFAAATALRQALRDSEFFAEPTPSAELDKTSFTVQIPILRKKSGGAS